jgi:hypothetical protein
VRADRLARRLEAGMVFVNNYMRRAFLGSPFGGVKGSGFGRENARETLHEFVRSKNIRFPSGRGAVPVWPPTEPERKTLRRVHACKPGSLRPRRPDIP